MKLSTIIFICVAGILLSGCMLISPIQSSTQGPPPWAPAHGYRRKQANIVIIAPQARNQWMWKNPGRGKGRGRCR